MKDIGVDRRFVFMALVDFFVGFIDELSDGDERFNEFVVEFE